MNRLYGLLGRTGATLLLLALVLGAVWWGYSTWASGKTAKAEARLGRETAEATIDTVEVANKTSENINRSAADIDAETKELANDILSAPPGQRNAAATRAVCRMRAYRNRPECAAVRTADPGQPAGGHPAR